MASTQQESDPAVSNEAYELYSGSNGERDNVNLWTGPEPEQATRAYPRADGGKEAWLFLGSCFMFEAFVWGFPFSYGVFQVYYSTHPPFSNQNSSTGIAAIGTTQTGLMYFSAPLVALVMQRYPETRRPGMFLGALIVVVALLAASFCNTVSGLLATQGVLYAVGGLLLYYPAMIYVDEWFVKRKGLAYGMMWAGSGSAGVVVPFLLQWLLDEYGFRTALRVWTVILAVGITPCLFWVKGRLPITASNRRRPVDFSFMKLPSFWLFEAACVLQSLAFFLPALWLPTFSNTIGLPKIAGPLSIALINLTTCIGAVLVGLLVDRWHISVAISVVTVGQIVAIFVFWGLTSSQGMLYTFALLWGLFGGGFSSTWSGYTSAVARKTPNGHVEAGLLLSLCAAGRGVGAVITGPLSETLLKMDWKPDAAFAYGTNFAVLIIFSGIFASLSGIPCVGRLLKMV